MKTKRLISIVLIILTVVYCGIAALAYDASSGVEILCVDGSYAENWAKRHGADYQLTGSVGSGNTQLNLGTFDYNLTNDGCVILGCHTIADTIVLPEEIDGHSVVGVDAAAFANHPDLTHVYVPESVKDFAPLHTEQYTVHCYDHSAAYAQLQIAMAEKAEAEMLKAAAEAAPAAAAEAEKAAADRKAEAEAAADAAKTAQDEAAAAEKLAAEPEAAEDVKENAAALTAKAEELAVALEEANRLAAEAESLATEKNEEARRLAAELNALPAEVFFVTPVQLLADSDPIHFRTADIPFTYSETANGLELISYTGHDAQIVVPASINGQSVTAISFPVEEFVKSVALPETVQTIASPLTEPRFDAKFYVNILLVLLGLVVALVSVHLAEKRGDAAEQRFLGIPLLYSGAKYFLLLLIWAAVCLFFGFTLWLQAVIGVLLLAAAPIELLKVGYAAQEVTKTGETVRENTAFVRVYRVKADQLVSVAVPAVKPYCTAVAEEFRYADPVSDPSLFTLEEQIAARFETFSSAVRSGNEAAAKALSEKLIELLQERGKTCKLLK